MNSIKMLGKLELEKSSVLFVGITPNYFTFHNFDWRKGFLKVFVF